MPKCKNRNCRRPLEVKATGRPRVYCSNRCRQAAYERRARQSVLFSSAKDEWPTDPKVFAELDREFGGFTLDVCATAENAKCPRFYDREQNGLVQPWTGRVWCNPPYGRTIGEWIRKAWEAAQGGEAEIVVCLVPARTDTTWWHAYCLRGERRYFQGRLRFGDGKYPAPFPSALVVFRNANLVTKLTADCADPDRVAG